MITEKKREEERNNSYTTSAYAEYLPCMRMCMCECVLFLVFLRCCFFFLFGIRISFWCCCFSAYYACIIVYDTIYEHWGTICSHQSGFDTRANMQNSFSRRSYTAVCVSLSVYVNVTSKMLWREEEKMNKNKTHKMYECRGRKKKHQQQQQQQ